jgi:type I restriction enzyme M protein
VQNSFHDKANFIWSVADLLRGPYRPNQYKDVMLPMTVLRRLDCVLEPSKEAVLARARKLEGKALKNWLPVLKPITGYDFYNTSPYTFEKLKADPEHIAQNLAHFIKGFSERAREILDSFHFDQHIAKLDQHNRLYLLVQRFCEIGLHPDVVSNHDMGTIFEELIRRFNEASNEEAGDHFTPREVIRLMVDLLFSPDDDILAKPGIIKTLYDPCAGTGGMLSVAEEYVRELHGDAHLEVFGQDYNDQAYAICGSDMMVKGQSMENIRFGDSFTDDHFPARTFDYMLANPPFGLEWKPEEDAVRKEHETQGFRGRFGAGLPRINDGSLLFLLHMLSKMKPPDEGGTRLAIVFNASPLFTGGAGSGESEIRRWIVEQDWLEAVVALPDQLFYNTGISTYLWVLTNRKTPERNGKIQLIDATSYFQKLRRSLGQKRNEIGEAQRVEISRLHGAFQDGPQVRLFDNADFGFRRITVERPLRLNFAVTPERLERVTAASAFAAMATSRKRKDTATAEVEIAAGRAQQAAILQALEALADRGLVQDREAFSGWLRDAFCQAGVKVPAPLSKAILAALGERDPTAPPCLDAKGNPEPDPELRDYEQVPLKEDIAAYIAREVLPHVPDAWVDESKIKVGYEINFNRHFYTYTPPRSLEAIDADLQAIEREIARMLEEVAA